MSYNTSFDKLNGRFSTSMGDGVVIRTADTYIKAEQTEGGVLITATDVSGTTTALLPVGPAGPEGPPGPKGATGPQGVSGVYIGGGDMPEGYDVQIDPDGIVYPALPVPAAGDAGKVPVVNEAGNGYTLEEQSGGAGAGLTTAQVNALDGLFKIPYYKEDVSAAYAAFRSAFGLSEDSGEPDTPDEPDEPVVTTYTVTNNLTDVTNSNADTTASGSYGARLSAAEGYTVIVTITMGGVDVTADVYTEDGTILITEVTGDIVITATAELAGMPVLYQLANTPVTCNADLYEDTGLTFGSNTANGYTKAWTMVARVSNMTAGTLWGVGVANLSGYHENRWNSEVENNATHLTTKICAVICRPSITQADPNSICVVITKEAQSIKTATVHYLTYAGELKSDVLTGTYGQFNTNHYAGNMMVGGLTAADFVGTIEEFTIYEGVATEDQVKAYLGVA